jgi:hypothetical protein
MVQVCPASTPGGYTAIVISLDEGVPSTEQNIVRAEDASQRIEASQQSVGYRLRPKPSSHFKLCEPIRVSRNREIRARYQTAKNHQASWPINDQIA